MGSRRPHRATAQPPSEKLIINLNCPRRYSAVKAPLVSLGYEVARLTIAGFGAAERRAKFVPGFSNQRSQSLTGAANYFLTNVTKLRAGRRSLVGVSAISFD
jgi:hypothetical protein